MKLLHFTQPKGDKEYIVLTHENLEQAKKDFAKPGFVFSSAHEVSLESAGILPLDTTFVPEN